MKRTKQLTLDERRQQLGELVRDLTASELAELLLSISYDTETERRRASVLASLEDERQAAQAAGDKVLLAHVNEQIVAWSGFTTSEARAALGLGV